MPSLKIMQFNVENLLERFRFQEYEKGQLATLLEFESEAERAELVRTHWNVVNDENRTMTALCARAADAEVICLQEVESMRALRAFHDRYLKRTTGHEYPYQVLIEANDPRGIDVAVLSRFKIDSATTHQSVLGTIQYPDGPKKERIFRRDCLEVHVQKAKKLLPIFVCHFKSMMGGRGPTRPVREAEAAAVRAIIEGRFPDPAAAQWVIVGDLNDYTETDGTPDAQHGLGALLDGGFCVDLIKRIPDPEERWTHFYSTDGTYHQLDYVLASPALAAKNQNVLPELIRTGQPYRAERYQGPRWPRTGWDRPKASDHCPVVVNLKY